ncbi:proteoglycan 4-like [Macrobrachium rosenbergii]|uniref:proteoglycan 4-like n=1 Tax=Macrobrachium rosenbergii TaxID=79674 RepID=UPI0034D49D02
MTSSPQRLWEPAIWPVHGKPTTSPTAHLKVHSVTQVPHRLTRPKNGLPSKRTCTHCKKVGHTESDCHYKLGNNKSSPTNNQNSSPSTSSKPSPPTVTAAGLQKIPHPKRLDTRFISVAPLDGSSLPMALPVTVDTTPDVSLIARPQVPASTTVDEQTRWEVKWVEDHTKTIPAVKLQVMTPWGTLPHRLGMPNSSYPQGIAPLDPSSGMPDHQSLLVPLASSEQCHTPSISDIEPPQELGPVPDPDHETDPPTGDSGTFTPLILATCKPPAPDTSSSPTPFPEDEPLMDQTATPSHRDQELTSPDAEIETTLILVVAAA